MELGLQFDLTLPRRRFTLELEGVFDNRTVGIFGPSGAGKTSFFNLLAGLERPSAGKIILNGRVLTDTSRGYHLPPHRRRIGVVFQEKLLFPHLRVRQNLLFGMRYVDDHKVSLNAVADLLDLSSVLDSRPSGISGGEQQRTALGRALLTSPELLLLDEPFNALDNGLRRSILPYLKRLREELEIPVLVISHHLPDIQRLTNIAYLIDRGRSPGYGEIIELFKDRRLAAERDLANVFHLNRPETMENGLFDCPVEGAGGLRIKTAEAPQDRFTLVLQPNEIALSRRPVGGISIQNQLPGRVEKIIVDGNRIRCILDIGIRIIADITPPAMKALSFEVGDTAYCLFKAHSLVL